jgi:hypothetical protein
MALFAIYNNMIRIKCKTKDVIDFKSLIGRKFYHHTSDPNRHHMFKEIKGDRITIAIGCDPINTTTYLLINAILFIKDKKWILV